MFTQCCTRRPSKHAHKKLRNNKQQCNISYDINSHQQATGKRKDKGTTVYGKIDKKAVLSQELPRDAVTLVQKDCT